MSDEMTAKKESLMTQMRQGAMIADAISKDEAGFHSPAAEDGLSNISATLIAGHDALTRASEGSDFADVLNLWHTLDIDTDAVRTSGGTNPEYLANFVDELMPQFEAFVAELERLRVPKSEVDIPRMTGNGLTRQGGAAVESVSERETELSLGIAPPPPLSAPGERKQTRKSMSM